MMRRVALLALLGGWLLALPAAAEGIGSRVFVVERASESLAVYDFMERKLLPKRITGLGNLRHATMIFTPDLRYGFLATRSGKVSRIDLEKLEVAGEVFTSENSIDNAISQDGRFIATAEYVPGGVTILDARSLEVLKKHRASFELNGNAVPSRATGIVDAPGNLFVCVLIEAAEIWIIDASKPGFPITHRIKTKQDNPYDAMITPDGRYYVVGHMKSDRVTVLDLTNPDAGIREVSLRDPKRDYERGAPVKLPHLASWAVAGKYIFVPLVGEDRLAVLDRATWEFERSIPLRGHPVYAVRSPTEREVWVSFSGEEDDAYVQVVDVESLKVTDTIEVGGRIYHMDFTPRGSHVLVSANRANKLFLVNANSREIEDSVELKSPSGVFGVWRAFRIGL
ncbi:MAG: protein nirF [Deltaproteobacteria bacterium]|nr:protein nirF [Deltaproteobacteria bacterium]MBW2419833.1 protein nirF [Deltaproteobacteria bacterium]